MLLFLNTLITLNWFIYSIRVSNNPIISSNEFQNHHIIHISIQICEYELEPINDMNAHIFYFHIHSYNHHNDQIVILTSNVKSDRTIDEYTWMICECWYRYHFIHVLFPHYTLIPWIQISSEYYNICHSMISFWLYTYASLIRTWSGNISFSEIEYTGNC